MASPRCRDCRYFIGDKTGGECRRFPPTMVIVPGKSALGEIDFRPSAAFPPVTSETWCGEFFEQSFGSLKASEAARLLNDAARSAG